MPGNGKIPGKPGLNQSSAAASQVPCSKSNGGICRMNKMFSIFWMIAMSLALDITAMAEETVKVKLDWETQIKYDGIVSLKFLTVAIENGELVFDVLVHNVEKKRYMCFWVNTAEDAVHIDDELANVYKGGSFSIKPDGNKLAPNQRKRLKIVLPEPDQEVNLVNLHLGFHVDNTSGAPNAKCREMIANGELNFHKLNWDVSKIR